MNLFKKKPSLLASTLLLSIAFNSFPLEGFSNNTFIDSDNEYDDLIASSEGENEYNDLISSSENDNQYDELIASSEDELDYDDFVASADDELEYDDSIASLEDENSSTISADSLSSKVSSIASSDGSNNDVTLPTPTSKMIKNSPLLELKAGYFFFASHKMRKIYDKGGWDVQLSGSFPVWKWLDVYSSVEYLERSGNSLNSGQKTSIWIVPLSLGLKPVFRICPQLEYYFAIGPRYIFLRQHNRSSYVSKFINNNGFAGFVNTGFNFFVTPHFVIDIFGEYSYAKLHTKSSSNYYGQDTQLGGFTFGGGVGYAF